MTHRSETPTRYRLGPVFEFLQHVWRLNHALERVSAQMDKQMGISAQQQLVTRCVGRYPGVNAGQLAALLHVDPGTLTAILKRLEGKELLERRKDPRDGRRTSLGLTAKGRALCLPASGTTESAVERLLSAVTPDELAITQKVLEHLATLLEQDLDG